jgi:hypothetical protein
MDLSGVLQAKKKSGGLLQKKNDGRPSLGAPEPIRTADPFLRREVLYPAELRAQRRYFNTRSP